MIQTRTAVAVALALTTSPAAVYAAETAPLNEDQIVVTATGFSQERREARQPFLSSMKRNSIPARIRT